MVDVVGTKKIQNINFKSHNWDTITKIYSKLGERMGSPTLAAPSKSQSFMISQASSEVQVVPFKNPIHLPNSRQQKLNSNTRSGECADPHVISPNFHVVNLVAILCKVLMANKSTRLGSHQSFTIKSWEEILVRTSQSLGNDAKRHTWFTIARTAVRRHDVSMKIGTRKLHYL